MKDIKEIVTIIDYLNDKITDLLEDEPLTHYDAKNTSKLDDQTDLEWIVHNRNLFKEELHDAYLTLSEINKYHNEMLEMVSDLKDLADEQGE